MIQLSDLAAWLQVDLLGQDYEISQVVTDSRCVTPGALFVAIMGPSHDGHDYLKEACERGAVAAIVARPCSESMSYLFVGDTLSTYARIAAYFRHNASCPVVALTGTCGKTTVKSMLGHVLSHFGETLMTHANHNNQVGVPQTLVRLKAKHEFAVVEVGANHVGEIEQMATVIEPDVALITNVGHGHLEGFGGIHHVMKEKSSLFSHLKPGGIAVINGDQPYQEEMSRRLKHSQKIVTFGLASNAIVRAEDIIVDQQGCASYTLIVHDRVVTKVRLSLLGDHQVSNSLAALAVCYALDINLLQSAARLATLPQVPGRMNPYKLRTGALVIDDSYNANPDSFNVALSVLSRCSSPRVLVMGDMAELGDEAVHFHQVLGQKAKSLNLDQLLAVGDQSAETVRHFGSGGQLFESQDLLLKHLEKLVHNEVSILIKGSNSSQMNKIASVIVKEETEAYV